MKLIVIIPALNEESTIGQVIQNVPRAIDKISEVEVFVINDGSTDKTEQSAYQAGADKVINNKTNLGLAKTFKKGVEAALQGGADIIVNIDADGQHNPKEIEKLIEPIINKKADMVVGNRQIKNLKNMKWGNKYGNLLGNWVIKKLTGKNIKDASCGFRALSREVALKLNIFFSHTYTHETIIQSAAKNLIITNIDIGIRPRLIGKSKLIAGIFKHIKNSSLIIIRAVLMYRPLKTLLYLGIVIITPGILLGLRVTYFYIIGQGGGKLHSLILTAILVIIGFIVIVLGLIGDLIANNRKISEEILYNIKKNKNKND